MLTKHYEIRTTVSSRTHSGGGLLLVSRPITAASASRRQTSISRPTHVELSEAAGPETLDADEQNNIDVYHKAIPSVVNITSKTMAYDFFYGPVPEEGQGSGFIIDKEGHVLTNYHVVGNATQVEVTLHNKKTYKAQVIGRDRAP